MTEKDLSEYISKTTLPLIKSCVEKDVGELVEASVKKSLEGRQNTPPEWVSRMFGDQRKHQVEREKGLAFGACVRAFMQAQKDPVRACVILKQWGHADVADAVEKAMTAGTPVAGGFMVPEQFSAEVVALMRPASILRRLGATVIQMPNGNLNIPKVSTGVTGYYVGESANITASQLALGQIKLSFKKLAALVPISNDLLRYSNPSADAVVRDDAVRCIAATENAYFIRSTGASGPKGLRYQVHVDNLVKAGTASVTQVPTDLGKMIGKLLAVDTPMTRAGWIFSPRTYVYLSTLQQTTGAYVFRDEMLAGRLWGWPFAVTTSIPENLTDGGSTAETEAYLVDFADVIIGESMNLVVDASSEAAYHDGSSVVSAFSRDETVVRIIEEHDLGVRRDKSLAVLYGCKYGT